MRIRLVGTLEPVESFFCLLDFGVLESSKIFVKYALHIAGI